MPMQVNYSKGTANGAVIKRIIGGGESKEPVFNFIKLSFCDQDTTDYYLNHLKENFIVTGNANNYPECQLLYHMGKCCNASKIELNRTINITASHKGSYIKADYIFQNSPNLERVGGTGCFRVDVPINLANAFAQCPKLKSVDMNIFQGTDNKGAYTDISTLFQGCTSLEEVLNLDLQNIKAGFVNAFGSGDAYAPPLKRLTFKKDTVFGKYYNKDMILYLYHVRTLTRDAIMEMLESMGTNNTGYVRDIRLESKTYGLLSDEDKAAFTAKNYTVSC